MGFKGTLCLLFLSLSNGPVFVFTLFFRLIAQVPPFCGFLLVQGFASVLSQILRSPVGSSGALPFCLLGLAGPSDEDVLSLLGEKTNKLPMCKLFFFFFHLIPFNLGVITPVNSVGGVGGC